MQSNRGNWHVVDKPLMAAMRQAGVFVALLQMSNSQSSGPAVPGGR
jgi:hypothetical protein